MIANSSSGTFLVFHYISSLRATFLECNGTPDALAGPFKEKAY